jgi:[ribosomal protein S5]-alanine N-acetyltransferase
MGFAPIVTERLVLRPYEERDRARLITQANNWRVAKNLGMMPFPYTEQIADEWLSKQAGFWDSRTSYPLVIALDGELIGGMGLDVRGHGQWELGYWLGEPYWNRGYASEGSRALVDFAFEKLEIERIVAGHYVDNHPSGRVLTKLGFRYTVEVLRPCLARGADVRCLEMTLTRTSWLEAAGRAKGAAEAGLACAI